tara:strand:- start:277 stop:540 length:264 start_codon:yes stop_codon:yes gene_type:complete
MKTNKLKNIFLGIIAINLTLLTLIQLNIWPTTVNANELNSTLNYGLVPLNEDGSINVKLSSSDVIDVNIDDVDRWAFRYCTVPVEIQ